MLGATRVFDAPGTRTGGRGCATSARAPLLAVFAASLLGTFCCFASLGFGPGEAVREGRNRSGCVWGCVLNAAPSC